MREEQFLGLAGCRATVAASTASEAEYYGMAAGYAVKGGALWLHTLLRGVTLAWMSVLLGLIMCDNQGAYKLIKHAT